jgi:hypothetical protein
VHSALKHNLTGTTPPTHDRVSFNLLGHERPIPGGRKNVLAQGFPRRTDELAVPETPRVHFGK